MKRGFIKGQRADFSPKFYFVREGLIITRVGLKVVDYVKD